MARRHGRPLITIALVEEVLDERSAEITLGIVGVDVKGKSNDGVRSQAHCALEIIALSVLDEIIDDQYGQEEDDGFEALEMKGHGLADDPTKDNEEGCHEEGDLHGASNGNINGEIHLALVSNDNGGYMLGGISNDRNKD